MNADLIVIIVGVISLIIGIFIGTQVFKWYNKKQEKKILENAKEVLEGKRDNKIKIDGEEYDATKFLLRDNSGKEVLIDLKEGGKIQNGRREENSSGIEEVQKQEIETPIKTSNSGREDSRSIGEKKRFIRVRSILSRIRRFG